MTVTLYIALLSQLPPEMEVIVFNGEFEEDASGPVIEKYTLGKCGWDHAEPGTAGAQDTVVLR